MLLHSIHISAFALDARSNGTVKEPHYYLNHQRATNLVVDAYNASNGEITFSSGDPREWFEQPVFGQTTRKQRVANNATNAFFGYVDGCNRNKTHG